MKPSTTTLAIPISLIVIGIALGAAGIYVGDTDDAPGAALLGLLMMIVLVTIGARTAWRRRK
jgi:NhaP-type Na+/H+ and K+/H+ antiporter